MANRAITIHEKPDAPDITRDSQAFWDSSTSEEVNIVRYKMSLVIYVFGTDGEPQPV